MSQPQQMPGVANGAVSDRGRMLCLNMFMVSIHDVETTESSQWRAPRPVCSRRTMVSDTVPMKALTSQPVRLAAWRAAIVGLEPSIAPAPKLTVLKNALACKKRPISRPCRMA
jgi:hypothetical protein